jgi:hypothetical protein
MKYLLFILTLSITYVQAQNSDCYELFVQGSILSSSKLQWSNVIITGTKDKLISFLRTDKLFASCNYNLKSPDEILNDAKKVDCNSQSVQLKFEDAKDVLQLSKDIKERYRNSGQSKIPEGISGSNGAIEMCINSDGEISLSYGSEYGSIQVTSKGKFSISSKTTDGREYKVEL